MTQSECSLRQAWSPSEFLECWLLLFSTRAELPGESEQHFHKSDEIKVKDFLFQLLKPWLTDANCVSDWPNNSHEFTRGLTLSGPEVLPDGLWGWRQNAPCTQLQEPHFVVVYLAHQLWPAHVPQCLHPHHHFLHLSPLCQMFLQPAHMTSWQKRLPSILLLSLHLSTCSQKYFM